MSKNNQKKKITWQNFIALAFFFLIGVIIGLLAVNYSDLLFGAEYNKWVKIISVLALFLILLQLHIIIHEAGHLLFGLLSGYKFGSFRIMSFMWVRENGKIKLKRFMLAGTGGQCIMIPPEPINGKFPVVLFNLGGSLMNIIAGLLFLGLHFAFVSIPPLSAIMLMGTVTGFLSAAVNGIPLSTGGIDNDGRNAVSLARHPNALRSFWLQLKITEQISKGIRLKDMPEEWFIVPSDEEMKNSINAAIGVFACNRLLDELRFEDAERLMIHLLEIDSGMIGIHRNMLICDRIYLELITENRPEVLDCMFTKEQKSFMKSMKSTISVIRTEYTYALLYEKNEAKAEKLRALFEKRAKTHPYAPDVDSERELIEIAEARYQSVSADA